MVDEAARPDDAPVLVTGGTGMLGSCVVGELGCGLSPATAASWDLGRERASGAPALVVAPRPRAGARGGAGRGAIVA
ncbi:hypothetical protein [Cellulomonas sp.]|uniref:hypothetical protein n=1 Tax=Cellulomonas sp. TaxID=40001 RepID=UPI00258A1099|nr:hypothetical protein [Cellulomonas sp.]MCR6688482.1 hypothetical protein [Cellulomonas sp.]